MIKLFKNFTAKDRFYLFIVLLLIIGQVWLELLLPFYMRTITLLVQTPGNEIGQILEVGGLMLLAALGSLALSFLVAVIVARVSTNFAANLRELLFDKVLSFSMEDMASFSKASLITRSTNDITQVQVFLIMGLQMIVKSPIMAVWAVTRISNTEWAWTLSMMIAIVLMISIIALSMFFAVPKFKIRQELTDQLNRVTRENLTGLQVIRAYNAQNFQHQKFEQANTDFTNTNIFVNRIMALMHPSVGIIMNGLTLAIYFIGAVLIQNTSGDSLYLFSDMVVFSSYATLVIMSVLMLIVVFAIFPQAKVSGDRILEVLTTQSNIIDGKSENGLPGKKGEIEFKNVSFHYPNAEENILKNISFKVEAGQTVAIIGATGSGKTSLINLIPRFFDATEGEVLINGRNVKEYTAQALNKKLGYVTQTAVLFSGKIKDNILYGDNAVGENADQTVKEAANIAQASEFIEKMDDRYDSKVQQSGSNFSGGQKQRLSVARAIARKPEILIFDDSFSALDFKTDSNLRAALNKQLPRCCR